MDHDPAEGQASNGGRGQLGAAVGSGTKPVDRPPPSKKRPKAGYGEGPEAGKGRGPKPGRGRGRWDGICTVLCVVHSVCQ